jgi:hypothetical protein
VNCWLLTKSNNRTTLPINNHHPHCPVDSKQKCEGSFKKHYLGISFGSQIWLNIIMMDDHQFRYIPPNKIKRKKLQKKKKTTTTTTLLRHTSKNIMLMQ